MMNSAKSITHEHLLCIINTEATRFPRGSPVRLLDVGCGDGQLLTYLTENLRILNHSLKFDMYGFDVGDHGVQLKGFIESTISNLSKKIPDVSWPDRISTISTDDKWPYSNGFFDIVISNQVLEHVNNHDLFFSEIYRTLRDGGISVHLFPLKHYLYETHLNLPLVHKIFSYDLLLSYIKLMSRLRFGKYKLHHRDSGISVEKYANLHADYIHYYTNYISYRESLSLAKKHRMRVSFKYTQELYSRKIQSLLSLEKKYLYGKQRIVFIDWLSVMILRYVSSITLFLEKEEIYRRR